MTDTKTQPEVGTSVLSHDAVPEVETSGITKRTWYRTVFFQATVVGVCAFLAPGLYNAMQSTGAGGQFTPYIVMSANAVLGVMMVMTCALGSVVANRIGLKNALIFGTSGYALYSASMYTNNRYGTEWFVYFGAAACGITAGVFWAAEGAIMISYSTGKTTGKLDWRTYIVFVALQCLGPFVGLFLSPSEKVQRQDGQQVKKAPRISTISELKAVGKILIRKDFLLVTPFFFYATFLLSYASSFLSLYFSVRARALASLVSALAQVTANFFFGNFLDWTRLSIKQRANVGYVSMMALFGGTWVWATIIQREYGQHKPSLDWVDSGFGRGWALYIILQVNFALAYNYGYWLAGYMARDTAEIIRFTSTVRAVEAAGGAVASGISSTSAPLLATVGVNFGLWGLALVPTYLVVRSVNFNPAEKPGSEVESDQEVVVSA